MVSISGWTGHKLPRAAALAIAFCLFASGCAHAPANQEPPHKDVTASSLMGAADQALASGDLPAAALLYQRAEQMAPNDMKPPLALGLIWSQMSQPREAMVAFQRVLQINPKSQEALRGLGNCQLQLGDTATAINTLHSAASLGPDWRIQNSIGVAYDMSGDFENAQQAYRQGLALSPGNMQLTSNLGLSLALSGKFDQALPMLEKAASDPQATPYVRQNLALAYGLAGDDAKAAEVAKIDLDPAKVQANLGYYEYLRLLHGKALAAAVGAHQSGMTQP